MDHKQKLARGRAGMTSQELVKDYKRSLQSWKPWNAYLIALQCKQKGCATRKDHQIISEWDEVCNSLKNIMGTGKKVGPEYLPHSEFYNEWNCIQTSRLSVAKELSRSRKAIESLKSLIEDEEKERKSGKKYRIKIYENKTPIGYVKAVFPDRNSFSKTTNPENAKLYHSLDECFHGIDYCTLCNRNYGYVMDYMG